MANSASEKHVVASTWARWFRWHLKVSDSFVCPCLASPTERPFSHALTGHALWQSALAAIKPSDVDLLTRARRGSRG